MNRAVAAVFLGPDRATAPLAGSAFPIAVRAGAGGPRVVLLTCLHVVWPTGPGPAADIWVGLPLHDPSPAARARAALLHRGWAPAADAPPIAADAAPEPPLAFDWAVLEVDLPAAEAWPWGPLDLVTAAEASLSTRKVEWEGRGFPGVLGGAAGAVGGVVIGRQPLGGASTIQLRVEHGGDLLDAKGLSGGPVWVGGRVVGMFVAAKRFGSALAGNASIGGTVYAHPLAAVLHAVRDHVPELPAGRVVVLPGVTPDAEARLVAADAAYGAQGAAERARLDHLATEAWRASQAGAGSATPVGEAAFLHGVMALAGLGGADEAGRLAPFLAHLAQLLGPDAGWIAALAPPPVAPAALPPADILAVEITPLPDGATAHPLTLRERRGGEWRTLARGTGTTGAALPQAVADLLATRLGDLPPDGRVQVWAPPEVVGLPYDEATVQDPLFGDEQPLGVARTVELRILWPGNMRAKALERIPQAVRDARAAALPALRAPLPAPPALDLPPQGDVPAVFLGAGAADAGRWGAYASTARELLVAAGEHPLLPDPRTSPLARIHLAGVPLLLWARGGDRARLDQVLSDAALVAGDIPTRLRRASQAGDLPRVSLVVEPPDDPLPDPALLDAHGGS